MIKQETGHKIDLNPNTIPFYIVLYTRGIFLVLFYGWVMDEWSKRRMGGHTTDHQWMARLREGWRKMWLLLYAKAIIVLYFCTSPIQNRNFESENGIAIHETSCKTHRNPKTVILKSDRESDANYWLLSYEMFMVEIYCLFRNGFYHTGSLSVQLPRWNWNRICVFVIVII